ncbi:MAG: TadE/TadG family type IV pilus assembly protein [Acidimicrobiia bacterium]
MSTRRVLRSQLRSRFSDRGAVIVESALILPLLLTLMLAIGEFGLAWRGRSTVQTAVRSGARAGSSLGTAATADYDILQGIAAGLGSLTGDVTKIVVYKSTTADGAVPSACLAGAVTGSCNVYTSAAFSYPSSSFGCRGTGIDDAWCPTRRVADITDPAGLDYLGVYIEVHHDYIAKLFGSGVTIKDHTVLRVEPQ